MTTAIRLARAGAKKRPYYQIVVTNSRNPRDGRFIEQVGTYNPMLAKDSGERVKLVTERVQYWLSVGAQPTDRVAGFLGNAGLMKKRPTAASTKSAAPKAKAQERLREQAERAEKAAAEAAEAAAAAAAPAAEEAPAAEAEASTEA